MPEHATPTSEQASARRTRGGPDRVTVGLFSLAAFLLVLSLLGAQLGHAGSTRARSGALLIRRIYRTSVIERVLPATAGGGSGTSVSQSVSGSSSGALSVAAAPITRTS
ncbi:MAG TPA: hypothetical protein VK252_00565 [Solirubrobacteraceae bacterium]|nr:hypothetical protein [Solirubrobacteraceae bacterium]